MDPITEAEQDSRRWLNSYQRRVDEIAARAATARGELAGLTATVGGERGAVTVTVDHTGALRDLSFGERADELTRPQLARAVLDASSRARAEVARRSREALEPLVGAAPATGPLRSPGAGG